MYSRTLNAFLADGHRLHSQLRSHIPYYWLGWESAGDSWGSLSSIHGASKYSRRVVARRRIHQSPPTVQFVHLTSAAQNLSCLFLFEACAHPPSAPHPIGCSHNTVQVLVQVTLPHSLEDLPPVYHRYQSHHALSTPDCCTFTIMPCVCSVSAKQSHHFHGTACKGKLKTTGYMLSSGPRGGLMVCHPQIPITTYLQGLGML